MRSPLPTLLTLMLATAPARAQFVDGFDEQGNPTQMDADGNSRNFNKHNNDTTKQNKEIPKGLRVWTIDRRFGDRTSSTPDTLPHLFPNTLLNTGKYGEYNTTGNNYTARQNRIVIDRPLSGQFIFTEPYSWVMKQPDRLLFTNTLSPITNITYDNCGNKTNGEDHIDALFAVNAGKRAGFGFDLNYAYARGYYSNQNVSHFGATLFGSYIGDRYQLHAMASTYEQKAAENGGITNDEYIRHPESFDESFLQNEIPTVLERNWNRNHHTHLFLTHRYNLGFYRLVPLTEEELKARQFAAESKKQHANDPKEGDGEDGQPTPHKPSGRNEGNTAPQGRPDGAAIAGDEPVQGRPTLQADTTRISVENQAKMDSLLAAKALQDSIDATMKREYVPVTSFIHTLELNRHDRIYQAYATPDDYYADTYFNYTDGGYGGDSIYDQTKHLAIKNTVALALLEGFNKWAKAGVKVFATHEWRKFELPDVADATGQTASLATWSEQTLSVGGQIVKSQGHTLHYNLAAETWLVGEDFGQLKVDFSTDLNFPLLGDTVTLAAKAYFYRLHPTFYQRHYHGKHLWWDNSLSEETRTRIEGLFSYRKTKTSLRVAIEEMQNYTYLATSYTYDGESRRGLTAGYGQFGGNINLLTLQLRQDFTLGPLGWENIVTYQNSNQQDILPVPALNVFTNLYLKFRIARVLATELGASATYFTKYHAPDFVPQLNQFAVQRNAESRVKLGGYPFVDAYLNFHLKHARFFVMYTHATGGIGSKNYFLAPHYPQNGSVLRMGVSWNFFN